MGLGGAGWRQASKDVAVHYVLAISVLSAGKLGLHRVGVQQAVWPVSLLHEPV